MIHARGLLILKTNKVGKPILNIVNPVARASLFLGIEIGNCHVL